MFLVNETFDHAVKHDQMFYCSFVLFIFSH